MSEKALICIAGLIGSGKTTITKQLVSRYGFERKSIGDELARLYQCENNLPDSTPVPGLQRMKTHKALRQTDTGYMTRFILDGDYERRVVDGLRNYDDALRFQEAGGHIIALVAPRPLRLLRKLNGPEPGKDPDLQALVTRDISELNSPDPDLAQAISVMCLATESGCLIDASQPQPQVLADVVTYLQSASLI